MATECTICGTPMLGSSDDDRCCLDCDAINFPPPEDIPQAARLDGLRALRPQEAPHDAPTP